MKLFTHKIMTGKAPSFEDFIVQYKEDHQIKTAAVEEENIKVEAEQEEADSSGQLAVEPLHQKGESTEMPKKGPSAKKECVDGEKSTKAETNEPDEAPDSGQSKAEGSEKFTNNPKAPSKEEKGGSAEAEVKVAGCEKCKLPCSECKCDSCDCKSCTEAKVKEAQCKEKPEDEDKEEKKTKEAALEDLPQAVQDKIKGKKTDTKDCSDEDEDKDKDKDKDASKKTEFVKIANLDSKNKSFLTKYWRQLFGDDYVNALVADK